MNLFLASISHHPETYIWLNNCPNGIKLNICYNSINSINSYDNSIKLIFLQKIASSKNHVSCTAIQSSSFYKKWPQLLRQPLWIRNYKTKIWKSQRYLSELIFKFICLGKLVMEGTNKRLLFPIFFPFVL